MATLFWVVLLAAGHAFRYEQLEEEDVLPRLRAFDETGLRQLMKGHELPLTLSSFAETNASFPEVPFFWRERLTIVKRLGSGSYGEVFKCKVACAGDDEDDFATLKLITRRNAFIDREIGFLKKMNEVSDYCVSAVGSPATFHSDEGTWLLMPYLNGGDFLKLTNPCWGNKGRAGPGYCRLSSQPKNDWDNLGQDILGHNISNAIVLAYFHQIVQGVEALHSSGIIHTDLKPENAMLSCRDGKCFASVIDLGLGCEPNVTGSCGKTGTPSYLAPEVWKEQPRSALTSPMRDVWSLGVMLYLLAYPRVPPFMKDKTGQTQIKYKPSEDTTIGKDNLDLLIAQMLDPDPRMRAPIATILSMLEEIIKTDYAAPREVIKMIDEKPVDRGATMPVAKCLFDKLDYDVGDQPFEREMCVDDVTEAKGIMRCGVCVGCNPCCKCRVLRHGQKVKEHFRQRVCK
ncbi:Chek2 [Symbiodinium microadriaticum]|nr:Chek2 [Symbiodinium microadriaticum]CAE7939905.1 Chek2 [Symbiodinium sp. KB8]